MSDKLAGKYYLDRAQYLVQRQGWLGKEAWVVVVESGVVKSGLRNQRNTVPIIAAQSSSLARVVPT